MKRLLIFFAVLATLLPVVSMTETNSGAATIKKPVQGLLDRQKYSNIPVSYRNAVHNFVLNAKWADLQPVQGGPIVHPNVIDTAIAQARAAGMSVKLRATAGMGAPTWAKSLGGAPVTLHTEDGTSTYTVPRFWTDAYNAAYTDFNTKLAAAYDGVDVIREWVPDRAGLRYAEPYLRDTWDARNRTALLQAGYTIALDHAVQNLELRDGLVWQTTLTDLAFNPAAQIRPDGTVFFDVNYTISQMQGYRMLLGNRAVLSNDSLSSTRPSEPKYGAMYDAMKALGPPIDIQTATKQKIGDWRRTLDYAATYLKASSVELPYGYQQWPVRTLATYAARLAANPTSQ